MNVIFIKIRLDKVTYYFNKFIVQKGSTYKTYLWTHFFHSNVEIFPHLRKIRIEYDKASLESFIKEKSKERRSNNL